MTGPVIGGVAGSVVGAAWSAVADPVEVGGVELSVGGVAWSVATEPVEGGEEIGGDTTVGAWISGSRRARSIELPAVVAITFVYFVSAPSSS